MRPLYTFLIFTVLALPTLAQEQKPRAEHYWKGLFKGGMVLRVDGQEYKRRFWEGSFRAEEAFASNLKAADEARQYEKYAFRSQVFIWGGITSAITYLVISNHNDNFKKRIYYPLLLTGLLGSVYYGEKSLKHLTKAIEVYNSQPVTTTSWNFSIGPTLEGGNLALTYDF